MSNQNDPNDPETRPLDGLSSEDLDELVYVLTAKRLVEALRSPEVSPGMLQAALRFMKDNGIAGLPMPGTAAAELEERLGSLPFAQPKRA